MRRALSSVPTLDRSLAVASPVQVRAFDYCCNNSIADLHHHLSYILLARRSYLNPLFYAIINIIIMVVIGYFLYFLPVVVKVVIMMMIKISFFSLFSMPIDAATLGPVL